MASLRQILANQQNARKSTGPTTAEGKDQSRRNALKHGLAGTGLLLPEEETAAAAERIAQWDANPEMAGPYEHFLVETIAVNSVRIQRCHQQDAILRELLADRAELCWDDDRRLAAEELGLKLPKAPAAIARQLRRTRQGCDFLIERWDALGRILDAQGDWDEAQHRLALDLLGTPIELRAAPTPLDADPAARRALVGDQVDRLKALQARALDDLDDREHAAAEVGLGPIDRELALVRRYEQTCVKRLEWAFAQLKARRPAGTLADSDALALVFDPDTVAPVLPASPTRPAPDPAPAPEPARPATVPAPAPVLPPHVPAPAPLAATVPDLKGVPIPGRSCARPVGNRKARRAAEARARRS